MKNKDKNIHDMKVVFLAGGKGTRLGPLAKDVPKPMVRIDGRPILEYIVLHVSTFGFKNFLFKTGHLSQIIEKYFGDGRRFDAHIEYLVEHEPLGTAGGLGFLKHERLPVFILYGDVLFDLDLLALLEFHRKKRADATMVLYASDHPGDCDIVVLDGDRIKTMIHKPGDDRFGNLSNAAIYIIEPHCFALIPEDGFFDLDKDFFPSLISKGLAVYGYTTKAYIQDAGTPERIAKVSRDIKSGKFWVK